MMKSMRKRIFTLLFLPAIVILWTVGWSLYWIGSQKTVAKPTSKGSKNSIIIDANLFQEQKIP